MGKQSRRKGNKQVNKENKTKNHKQRQQERRDRLEDYLDYGQDFTENENENDSNDEGGGIMPSASSSNFLVGDRVFFFDSRSDKDDPNTYRGIVKRVWKDVDIIDSVDVIPLSCKNNKGGGDVSWKIPVQKIFIDGWGWTLRFDVGEKVLCRTGCGWLPATILRQWPIDQLRTDLKLPSPFRDNPISVNNMVFYTCLVEPTDDHGEFNFGCNYDNDAFIRKYPTKLRFSRGDKIIFSIAKAKETPKRFHKDVWMTGTISRTMILGMEDYFAVYECAFTHKGRIVKCHILNDDDEHVASVHSTPRDRLMDAIDQNCCLHHFELLASLEGGMDVSIFQDAVLTRAINAASYHALLWLQKTFSVNLDEIEDSKGNTLLHQIALSQHAIRFLEVVSTISLSSDLDSEAYIHIQYSNSKRHENRAGMIHRKNEDDETWLDVLIRRGNIRALDFALNPTKGVVWLISTRCRFEIEEATALHNAARKAKRLDVLNIVEGFLPFNKVRLQDIHLYFAFSDSEDDMFNEDFMNDFKDKSNSDACVRRFIRFVRNWEGFSPTVGTRIETTIKKLASKGFYRLVTLFVEAECRLISDNIRSFSIVNRDEYIQPQIRPDVDLHPLEVCNLISLTIKGPISHIPSKVYFVESCWQYFNSLEQYLTLPVGKCSWLSYIKYLLKNKDDYKLEALLTYRANLLEDHESLQGRLKILEFLIKEKNVSPPILDVIKFRQCGILRWMVAESIIDLNIKACLVEELVKAAKKLQIFKSRKIPSCLTVGAFLCFAAVEFDDLQSLEWLVGSISIPLQSLSLDGWNFAHACAYFGRLEIIVWLSSQPSCLYLVSQICKRNPWEKAYVAHIAVQRGHIMAADMFLSFECPNIDNDGNSIESYALMSNHEHVKEWGSVKANSDVLAVDLCKLLDLLLIKKTPFEKIKKRIASTKCMDYSRWKENGLDTIDTRGTFGSYLDVLIHCCTSKSDAFVLWLCNYLYWGGNIRDRGRAHRFNTFWGDECSFPVKTVAKLENDYLVKFAININDISLTDFLVKSWTRQITCFDPMSNKLVMKVSQRLQNKELLLKIRNKILTVDILNQVFQNGMKEVRSQLSRGYRTEEINETINTIRNVAVKLSQEEEVKIDTYFNIWDVITSDGLVNLECAFYSSHYENCDHPLKLQVKWLGAPGRDISKVHLMLAMEGYHELIHWCLTHAHPWESTLEIEIIQTASFFGHSKIMDIFLDPNPGYKLLSTRSDRFQAAMLGAAEAGRATDLIMYMELFPDVSDPLLSNFDEIRTQLKEVNYNDDDAREEQRKLLYQSLSLAAVCGCLTNVDSDCIKDTPSGSLINNGHLEVLKSLVIVQGYNAEQLLGIVELVLSYFCQFDTVFWELFLDLFSFLCKDLHLKVWNCIDYIDRITQSFLRFVRISERKDDDIKSRLLCIMDRWLGSTCVRSLGLDIQSLELEYYDGNEFLDHLTILKEQQLSGWDQFQVIKHDNELLEVQTNIHTGALHLDARDKGGQLLTHVAAAYDRADVLQWLVVDKGMNLNDVDGQGRNVLKVAQMTKASSTFRWIVEQQAKKVISSFLSTHMQHKLALQRRKRLLGHVIKIQTMFRGYTVRQAFRTLVILRLKDSQRFQEIWKRSLLLVSTISNQISNWSSIRDHYCCIRIANSSITTESMLETDKKLVQATAQILTSETDIDDQTVGFASIEIDADRQIESEEPTILSKIESGHRDNLLNLLPTKCTRIQLASYVIKWLNKGDPKYRQFFVRRMKQLAAGDRSRILAKNLKGSKSVIFETYLEQKSGYRILWTEGENKDILVWFVAKHKNVSRLMRLIDNSVNRSARQMTSIAMLPEFKKGGAKSPASISSKERILLDPLGNVPLKLYNIYLDNIEQISNVTWKPQLHLTEEERDIVEAKGTVLVLGRSGTGKTICICNRMDYDRQRMSHYPTFSQLFVARSPRLCNYVRDTIGKNTCTSFTTFGQLIKLLEHILPQSKDMFLPSQRMDFRRFKNEIYKGNATGEVDALIVWTNIQAFLKGSIEAIKSPGRILAREDYIAADIFGKKRCRLTREQRESVYEVFLRYQTYMATHLWDDCDRIISTIERLEDAKISNNETFEEIRKSKVYVDEIQDYTQAEILLFFYICGPGDLFLAGDPAQSVVLGVEFRFEDIRAVGYHIAGPERRDLIPQKPKIVNVNFRSHSGILDTAATILQCLFDAFPDSAKQLKKDRGLFQGPRPGIFHKVDPNRLSTLVSEKLHGIIVLVHDNDVSRWKRILGGYPLIYGIREAKGLEFKRMILLDFFIGLPCSVQKPFRDLLLGRSTANFNICFPQIEGILKLLYTAVTRCIEKLFIAETSSSSAGDAFVRRLTTTSIRTAPGIAQDGHQDEALATRNSTDDIEKMVMTRDEWVATGIDNAEMAEEIANTDLAQAEVLLDKAIYCFEQAKENVLGSMARTHCCSIRFRLELLLSNPPPSITHVESRASWLIERLLAENLLFESRNLCSTVLPLLSSYTSDQLEQLILRKLPQNDQY